MNEYVYCKYDPVKKMNMVGHCATVVHRRLNMAFESSVRKKIIFLHLNVLDVEEN